MLSSADPVLGDLRAPWLIQFIGPLVFFVVLGLLIVTIRRAGTVPIWGLLFIATTCMFWQEFYADWGAYLHYNTAFHQLPWWIPTRFTTSSKPAFVPFGYGWFYAGVFPPLLALVGKARGALPKLPRWLILVAIVAPIFFAWNLVTADGAAHLGHWWSYVQTYGPTLHSARGDLPFAYPALPFVLFAVGAIASVDAVDDQGRRWYERALKLPATGVGRAYEFRRAGTWILAMNFLYLVLFTGPVMIIREAFLSSNAIVR